MYPELQVVHFVLSSLHASQLFLPATHTKGKKQLSLISWFNLRDKKDRVVTTLQTSTSDIKKVRSYRAQYPILRTVQSAWLLTSLPDLFTHTLPQLIGEVSIHMLELMREDWSYTYQSLSIAKVLIYTSEWTGVILSENTIPWFYHCQKRYRTLLLS